MVASGDAVRLLVALLADLAISHGLDAAGMGALFTLLGGFVTAGTFFDFRVLAKGGDKTHQ